MLYRILATSRNKVWSGLIQANAIPMRSLVSSPGGNDNDNGGRPAQLQNQIQQLLMQNFPAAQEISVRDISGGCGSMFEVFVASRDFQGMPKVKQHLKVSAVLKEEIKDMHGIRIFTEVP